MSSSFVKICQKKVFNVKICEKFQFQKFTFVYVSISKIYVRLGWTNQYVKILFEVDKNLMCTRMFFFYHQRVGPRFCVHCIAFFIAKCTQQSNKSILHPLHHNFQRPAPDHPDFGRPAPTRSCQTMPCFPVEQSMIKNKRYYLILSVELA